MRRITRAARRLVFFLVAVEGLFFAFGLASMHWGNPYRLYDRARLLAEIERNLEAERAGSMTGWPNEGEHPIRPHPHIDTPRCGSAWGGSFTYADDVLDAEAWPHLLSLKLGCQVDNRGTDGFGLDQTLLQFRQHDGSEPFVILGLAEPMITVDALASWTFISLSKDKQPRAALTKPFFTRDQDRLQLTPRPAPDVGAIEQHYAKDRSAQDWTAFRFPFTLHVVRAIYRKFRQPAFNDLSPVDDEPGMLELRRLAARLIFGMAQTARDRNQRFVLLFIPRPEDALAPHLTFRNVLDNLRTPIAGLCVIDPAEELKSLALTDPHGVMTASGHFSASGNAALANATLRGLKTCGLAS